MRFTSKRKYTLPFLVFLLILIGAVTFYFVGPNYINQSSKFFLWLTIITVIDSFLIILFIHGLYKVVYILESDKLTIKRSLVAPLVLKYDRILEVTEIKNDHVFLNFGAQSLFIIKYQAVNRVVTFKVRPVNPDLFKIVLENERKISLK